MELPSRPAEKTTLHPVIKEGLNIQPLEVYKARDYLLVYKNEAAVKKIRPNIQVLNQINLDPGGIIVTAKGDTVDFVSRFLRQMQAFLKTLLPGLPTQHWCLFGPINWEKIIYPRYKFRSEKANYNVG